MSALTPSPKDGLALCGASSVAVATAGLATRDIYKLYARALDACRAWLDDAGLLTQDDPGAARLWSKRRSRSSKDLAAMNAERNSCATADNSSNNSSAFASPGPSQRTHNPSSPLIHGEHVKDMRRNMSDNELPQLI